jgi:hypothetical protein
VSRALLPLAGLLLVGTVAGLGCRSTRNPELVLTPPRRPSPVLLTLTGTVVEAWSQRPVPNAQLRLTRLGGEPDTIEALTHPDGSFKYDSLRAGGYLLGVAFIGYRSRVDTLMLSQAPALRLIVPLDPASVRLGYWPTDSLVAAAARAQRHRWVCDRERDSIEREPRYWAAALSNEQTRRSLQLSPGEVSPAGVRLIQDRATCLRAAGAFDRREGASGLATTVFRYGPYYLVSQPTGGSMMVLNARFELVQHRIAE